MRVEYFYRKKINAREKQIFKNENLFSKSFITLSLLNSFLFNFQYIDAKVSYVDVFFTSGLKLDKPVLLKSKPKSTNSANKNSSLLKLYVKDMKRHLFDTT